MFSMVVGSLFRLLLAPRVFEKQSISIIRVVPSVYTGQLGLFVNLGILELASDFKLDKAFIFM